MTSAVATDEHEGVEKQVIEYLRGQLEGAAASDVLGKLGSEDEISENDIKKALRILLQEGTLRIGKTTKLEFADPS